MRTIQTFLTLALAICFMAACSSNSGSKSKNNNATQGTTENAIQPIVPPTNPAMPEPAQNAEGVWHYTCSNGCAGGAGTQTACATCGSTLVHNAAYHNTGAPTTPNNAAQIETSPPAVSPVVANPEPAQNDKGVWHFTCSKGCAGGAGSAQPCANCGEMLAHNQVYHQ